MATASTIVRGIATPEEAHTNDLLANAFLDGVGRERMLVTLEATPDQLLALIVLAPVMHKFRRVDVILGGMWDRTLAHDIRAVKHVLFAHCNLRGVARVFAGWTRVRPGAPPALADVGYEALECGSARVVAEQMCAANAQYDAAVVLGDDAEINRLAYDHQAAGALVKTALAFARLPTNTHTKTAFWWQTHRIYMLPRDLIPAKSIAKHAFEHLAEKVAIRFPDLHAIAAAYAGHGLYGAHRTEATILTASLLVNTKQLRVFGLTATPLHATWWLHINDDAFQRKLHCLLLTTAREGVCMLPNRHV